MRVALVLRTLTAGLVLALGLARPAVAEPVLDKVSFGTNWVAEGEHGGFFQALADGTHKKFGLDVTIVEPSSHPWAKFASEKFGGFLQKYYEQKGVRCVAT